MAQNKMHYFFLYFFFFAANILNGMHLYPLNLETLQAFLPQNQHLIATPQRSAQQLNDHGTLAHFYATNGQLDALQMLFDHGETAAQGLNQNFNVPDKLVNSTAFLVLCFSLKNPPFGDSQKIIHLLKLFAQRTPSVVTMPRNDSMTPAMAIACSGSIFTNPALQVLIQHNTDAFKGNAEIYREWQHHEYPRTVLHLLVASSYRQTVPQGSLFTVLNTMKHQNIGHLKQELECVINYSYSISKPKIARFLERWSNVNLHNPWQPVQISTCSCITTDGQCLCCEYQCFCCQNPRPSNHTFFWFTFYNKNPQHPNASQWMQEYYKQAQNIW